MRTHLACASKVLFRNMLTYSKLWKASLLGNAAEPVFYLLAVGLGLGHYVQDIEGVPYTRFLAPALVCAAAMNAASMEAGFSAYARLAEQKTFTAMLHTPLLAKDIALGEILWAALKGSIVATVVFFVTFLFSLTSLALLPLLLPIIFLNALAFASVTLCITTSIRAWEQFAYLFALFLNPIFFFSGTFFPLDHFPGWVKTAAFLLPLYHTIEIARPLFLHRPPSFLLLRLCYIFLFSSFFIFLAGRKMEKRLTEE